MMTDSTIDIACENQSSDSPLQKAKSMESFDRVSNINDGMPQGAVYRVCGNPPFYAWPGTLIILPINPIRTTDCVWMVPQWLGRG